MNERSPPFLCQPLTACGCMLLCGAFKVLLMGGAESLSTFLLVNVRPQPGGTCTKTFCLLEICGSVYCWSVAVSSYPLAVLEVSLQNSHLPRLQVSCVWRSFTARPTRASVTPGSGRSCCCHGWAEPLGRLGTSCREPALLVRLWRGVWCKSETTVHSQKENRGGRGAQNPRNYILKAFGHLCNWCRLISVGIR